MSRDAEEALVGRYGEYWCTLLGRKAAIALWDMAVEASCLDKKRRLIRKERRFRNSGHKDARQCQ